MIRRMRCMFAVQDMSPHSSPDQPGARPGGSSSEVEDEKLEVKVVADCAGGTNETSFLLSGCPG